MKNPIKKQFYVHEDMLKEMSAIKSHMKVCFGYQPSNTDMLRGLILHYRDSGMKLPDPRKRRNW